ncbi:abortive infection family protein [Paenibacillus sp. P26]|nr:abortive infection family protein [Paenibacillus sp. P26]
MGCSVNAIRNKEGTGHGRMFLPNISQEEASNAIQAIGIVADYLLMKLKD